MTSLYDNWEDYLSDNNNQSFEENETFDETNDSFDENENKTNLSMNAFFKKQKLNEVLHKKNDKQEVTIISTKPKKINIDEEDTIIIDKPVKSPFSWGDNNFVPTFNKKFDSDFPSLSLLSLKTKKQEKHIIVEKEDDNTWIDIKKKQKNSIESSKTRLCKSILSGLTCTYGEKCQFAHSSKDLNTQQCGFGDDCKLIIFENNQYKNSTDDKTCSFLHPKETKENFMMRNLKQNVINKVVECIKKEKPITITIKKNTEKTQMCKSISMKKKCVHGKTCKFAHSIDELNVINCSFGDKCKLIHFKNNNYSNTDDTRICFYKHPSESKANFIKRNKLS